MGESFITVMAIALAAVLMFVFPMMTIADRNDDISQLSIQTATTEFVNDIRTTGTLSEDKYDQFIQNIASTGNTYEVEMEIQILDENTSKVSQAEMTKIGENTYYSLYTSQINEKLAGDRKIALKEGDIISVSVKNTNETISQSLKNFFYKIAGNDTYQIAAKHSGIVTVNGAK
ncbi:MAG: hypothetical protein Q4G05_00945 [Clostridia bacterium]|nr:hypothetical protein [Clostridia bacterium]